MTKIWSLNQCQPSDMPITIPPWLKAPDVAEDWARGAQIGASIAESKARLAAQADENAMRAQAEAKNQQQDHALRQQQIATTAAYRQQQIQLANQRLDETKAMNDQKTAAAARAFTSRQMLASDISAIQGRQDLDDRQKDQAITSAILRRGTETGIPGNELSSMFRAATPPKPTVPATVEDKGDFMQVTQPNGDIQLHAKPRAGSEGSVTVQLPDPSSPGSEATVYRTVPKSQAPDLIANLPPNLQTNAVNRAARSGAAPRPETGAPAKKLDPDTARSILKQVGGDKDKARAKAKEMGYTF
jgi:hypothetical protein